MSKRQAGFTLIEILVVITIIAALIGLVSLVLPIVGEDSDKVQCMNNLRQLGGLLTKMDTAGKSITSHSGAAFLLQASPGIKSDDLDVFICPGETAPTGRPEHGTDEFTRMYRDGAENPGSLDEEALRRMCSFAGPDWSRFPLNPASKESRLWACDACQNSIPHHPGIVTLWDSSKVTYIDIADLEGQDEESIQVGPHSGDKRLATMIFYAKQK